MNTKLGGNIWKETICLPIPKTQIPKTVEDLRPISLIHIAGKLLEKYITDIILIYLENKNILTHAQYGFRKNRCCGEAIYDYMSRVLKFYDKNKYAIALHLDIRKAFDSISHEILLQKIQNINFGTNLVQWFKSYLKNREN